MIIEDVYKVLQEEEIQNLDDEMIEDVLAHHILFARELDVIRFFRFVPLIKDNPERFNRLLTQFENSTAYSFWMGSSMFTERRFKRNTLAFYSYLMEEYKIKYKIKYGVFLLTIPNNQEENEIIRCCECIQDWLISECIEGEVIVNKTICPNEQDFFSFLLLTSIDTVEPPT